MISERLITRRTITTQAGPDSISQWADRVEDLTKEVEKVAVIHQGEVVQVLTTTRILTISRQTITMANIITKVAQTSTRRERPTWDSLRAYQDNKAAKTSFLLSTSVIQIFHE